MSRSDASASSSERDAHRSSCSGARTAMRRSHLQREASRLMRNNPRCSLARQLA
jgi:hypothetical protein